MENEIWKDIPGYEGLYKASNLGKVMSCGKTWTSGKGLKRTHGGKELKYSFGRRNYHVVGLNKNGKQRMFKVHRLIALTFIPNPGNLPQVNHKDLCRTNNCLDNLEWVTPVQNILHAVNAGIKFGCRGNHHGNAKITEDDVMEIRKSKLSNPELSKKFGVRASYISNIRHGRAWKHLPFINSNTI